MRMIYLVTIQDRIYFDIKIHEVAFDDYEEAKRFCKGMKTSDGYVYQNEESKNTIMPILLKE